MPVYHEPVVIYSAASRCSVLRPQMGPQVRQVGRLLIKIPTGHAKHASKVLLLSLFTLDALPVKSGHAARSLFVSLILKYSGLG